MQIFKLMTFANGFGNIRWWSDDRVDLKLGKASAPSPGVGNLLFCFFALPLFCSLAIVTLLKEWITLSLSKNEWFARKTKEWIPNSPPSPHPPKEKEDLLIRHIWKWTLCWCPPQGACYGVWTSISSTHPPSCPQGVSWGACWWGECGVYAKQGEGVGGMWH